MDAQVPSFMLLPAFTYLPDGEIQLGTVLPVSRKTKLPNASGPLGARISVDEKRISRYDHGAWHWNSSDALAVSGGVWSDASLLSGLGAGVDGNRGHERSLDINSPSVQQETFVPREEDIAKLKTDDTISGILQKFERPPVYVVTGRMIAHGADIEIKRSQKRGEGAHVSADLTSVGAPINVGIKGDVGRDKSKALTQSPKQSFILAYQLLKLRKKLLGSVENEQETKWALFSDEGLDEEQLPMSDLEMEVLMPDDVDLPLVHNHQT